MLTASERGAHAPHGGATIFGRVYRPGRFLPFYVPREMMPQVDEKDLPRFVADALADGYDPEFRVMETGGLRAHQRVSAVRVAAMDPSLLLKPILVSADGYVLDGNHRHAAASRLGAPWVPAIQIGLTFDSAVDWMVGRPYVYEIDTTIQQDRR